MENSTLIRKIQMDCPLRDKLHEVEERTRVATTIAKGVSIEYQERFYCCANSSEEECEFKTGSMLNENLASVRKAYKEKKNGKEYYGE